MPPQTVIISWVIPECKVIAIACISTESCFYADLLFLVDVFQPHSACSVHSIENNTDLKLQKERSPCSQPRILKPGCSSLCCFLGSICGIFFACFVRSLTPVLLQFDF
ncbi:hypothetical protein CEXT_781551 [Caerostris extrusa]|uniref:Uncharacterized protein n=1 Tax=Caerostris extrusa TaxID=172846 RepID=A0AAV4UT78_CAEEX|nr:hypothetical protein CEXT_781551 [Caerostris extrusa]